MMAGFYSRIRGLIKYDKVILGNQVSKVLLVEEDSPCI
jgi:hypothetical protein